METITTTGTSAMPVFATISQKYDEAKNTRPSWVDEMPDPAEELERYTNMEV